MLRIRIRDPVIFLPLAPGSGMELKSRSGIRDSEWTSRIIFTKASQNNGILCCGSGSGIRCLFDPKSVISIPDPQHCIYFFKIKKSNICKTFKLQENPPNVHHFRTWNCFNNFLFVCMFFFQDPDLGSQPGSGPRDPTEYGYNQDPDLKY